MTTTLSKRARHWRPRADNHLDLAPPAFVTANADATTTWYELAGIHFGAASSSDCFTHSTDVELLTFAVHVLLRDHRATADGHCDPCTTERHQVSWPCPIWIHFRDWLQPQDENDE